MTIVTVSPKWQVVIAKDVREKLPIEVGMHLQMMAIGDRIELLPLKPITSLRGCLPKSIDTNIVRDHDRL